MASRKRKARDGDDDFEKLTEDERFAASRDRKQKRGSKVQMYLASGDFGLSRTSAGYQDALRHLLHLEGAERTADAPSVKGIRKAIAENWVYHGYRWLELARSEPDGTVQALPPTVPTPSIIPRSGLVAKLNAAKDRVEAVYVDMTSAQMSSGLSSLGSMSLCISRGSKTKSGYYYVRWSDVEPALQTEYKARAELPRVLPRGHSVPVESVTVDEGTGEEVVKRYESILAALTEHKMTRKTLEDAIDKHRLILGATWRYVE